jgi:WD40 repeat protein
MERGTLSGHTGGVNACAISPDSGFIVTASADGTAKIWDAAAGEERTALTGHTKAVVACAISPDSGFIVTASSDHTAKIWDAATGEERATLPLLGPAHCVVLHPWQPVAVCGDGGGNVYLVDLVGIDYGPIVVTAVDLSKRAGPVLRCPKCLMLHTLNDAWVGAVIDCPTSGCGLSLRVNPFITRKRTRTPWWADSPRAGR